MGNYLEVAYEQPSLTSVFAGQRFWTVLTHDRYLHNILISMDPLSHFTRVLSLLDLYLSVSLVLLPLSTHAHRTLGEPSHTTAVEQSGALVIVHLHGGLLPSAMPVTASPWPTLAIPIDQ